MRAIRTDRRGGVDAAAAVALVVFWSSGFIGARLGTTYAGADTLLAWRFVLAGLVLVAVAAVTGIRPGREALRRQTVMGLLCQAGYLGGVVTGVGLGVPAGTAALMASLQPLVVAGLAGPMLGESVDRLEWLALAGGLMGVALVVGGDLGLRSGGGGAPVWAYALPVAGMLGLSVGTLLGRRWQGPESVLESLTLQTLVASVVFVGVAAGRSSLVPPADSAFWWSVAWVICLSSFGGYGSYLLVLRRSGATRVSAILYLTPPTTMLWAYVMFGDPVSALGMAGLAVCAVSVAVVLGRPGQQSETPDETPDRTLQRARTGPDETRAASR